MWRGNDELELPHLVRLHVDRAVGANVRLDAFENFEAPAVLAIQCVDLGMLLDRTLHAHAARNAQAVRVIGDPGARPSALETGVYDRFQRFCAVAPDRMHLEISPIAAA